MIFVTVVKTCTEAKEAFNFSWLVLTNLSQLLQ